MKTAAFVLAACLTAAPAVAQQSSLGPVSATIKIEQVQVAFIGSGAAGGGTVTWRGRSYPITVGGLGVGGIGVSKLTAAGSVYGSRISTIWPASMRRCGRAGRLATTERAVCGSRMQKA